MKTFTQKKSLFLFTILFISLIGISQVAINTDGTEPNTSAGLDVKFNNKGFLPPRMTRAQRDAISNPADGLCIYNITTECMDFYLGGTWKEFCAGTGTPVADYTIGAGESCANTSVYGSYIEGVALDGTNIVTLDAIVTTIGPWSITTNTVNGYGFSGSGFFPTAGTVQVMLTGTGTPLTDQTDNFTATANGSGGTCTFSVTVVPSCGIPISYGGQSYNTVEIGTQCWMAENLNIGTMINGSSDQTNNGTIEKYCYDDNSNYCDTYGGLYQWDEMMQYVTTEGTQGICPIGWHLPCDAEWMTMEENLGMCSGTGSGCSGATLWRGTNEGSKMAGNEPLWTNGDLDSDPAFGTSGLAVLPAGTRVITGSFDSHSIYALLWSSTENGSHAWTRNLYYNNTAVSRYHYYVANGFSVRCLRD